MFGKAKEIRRQWGLLGALLRSTRLLDALDFLHRAFGTSAMRWDILREAVALGESLASLAEGYGHAKIPGEVVDALRAGEKDGRLPERLEELLGPDPASTSSAAEEAGAVSLANEMLAQAVEKGLPRLDVGPTGRVMDGLDLPEAFLPALIRRLWVMAGQPYWAPKPGSFRMRMPKGDVEIRISPRSGGVVLELSGTLSKG